MTKNIIIGLLSAIIIIMALFSYSQKSKAEEMANFTRELNEQVEMQRVIADEARTRAEMVMSQAKRAAEIAAFEAEKASELANKK